MEIGRYIRVTPASIVVSVDEAADDKFVGSYLHVTQNIQKPFSSAAGLLLDLDILMNDLGMPQSYTELRTWDYPKNNRKHRRPKKRKNRSITQVLRKGRVATFILYIPMRRNSSWQGEVVWVEKNKHVLFRSVLELLHLIGSACDEGAYRHLGMPTWLLEYED